VFAGLVPWLLTDWKVGDTWLPLQVLGAALVLAGATALVYSFARFVTEGRGTPAPVAPTEQLVVGGLYRYVRNPMYVALLAAIGGQALLLGRWVLLAYAAVVFIAVYAFVRLYEEPSLAREYGAQYDEYRRAVPGWLPRVRR
jgi:protein-S-isoprenylcysteine O-methyltransferase Ste14